jgi:hypothetical protein
VHSIVLYLSLYIYLFFFNEYMYSLDDEHMSRSNSPPFTLPQPFAMLGDTSRSSNSSNSSSGVNPNSNSISSSSMMHQDIAAVAAAAGSASSSSRTTRGAHNSNTNYGRKFER